jgi:predicted Zn-dependent peptidase
MRPGGDTLTISVQGSPEDLEAGLQLAYALLTDGKIEESAFKNWKLRTLQMLERMQSMPRFQAMQAAADLLSGGDPRMRFPTPDDVNRQSVAAAQAWYDRLCHDAPIEVAVVGDIKLDDAMPLIERYVGSLPKRSRTPDQLDKLRKLARPAGPLVRNVEVGASYRPSWVYEDSAQFSAGAPCDPANAQTVVEEIHRVFADFAQNGPTEKELANAKKQVANNLDTEMKEPSYWWRILQHHDLHGRDLDEEKTVREAYEAYTAAQVRDVFQKYYQPDRQFIVTAVPVSTDTEHTE